MQYADNVDDCVKWCKCKYCVEYNKHMDLLKEELTNTQFTFFLMYFYTYPKPLEVWDPALWEMVLLWNPNVLYHFLLSLDKNNKWDNVNSVEKNSKKE